MVPKHVPRRIATLSVHTSPLDQPGTGDAGGLNVYVVEVAKLLADRGTEVEIFTRAVCRDTPPLAELAPGVLVRSVVAGPFEELDKTDLPGQVCQFTLEVLRAEAEAEPGRYDLVHAHYWLSGKVGAAAKERWGVPLVQSMHTLGKVKNAALAIGDSAEPDDRIRGEHEVVAAADRLIANTAEEARQLTELYGADPAKVRTVFPGADLGVFQPGSPSARRKARHKLGLPQDAVVLVFAGRVQPLKGPDIVLEAAARLIEDLARGNERRIGLGCANGRYFTFNAGLGLDAEVVRAVDGRRAHGRALTPALFARTALRQYYQVTDRRQAAIHITEPADLCPDAVFLCIVSNSAPWTYLGRRPVHTSPHASFDTGLDLLGFRSLSTVTTLRTLRQMLADGTGPLRGRGLVSGHDLKVLELTADRPVAFQLDGEYVGEIEHVTFQSAPAVLRVIGLCTRDPGNALKRNCPGYCQ